MRNDEQGRIGDGDGRARYERPELRELSVSETQGGDLANDLESFSSTSPGGTFLGQGAIPDPS
jgi:hypothetical protein